MIQNLCENFEGISAFRREECEVTSEQSIQDADETDAGGEVWLSSEGTDDERHDPSSQDVGLLRVGVEDGGMVGQDGLDKLQTESCGQGCNSEVLGPLGLCQKADVMEDLGKVSCQPESAETQGDTLCRRP
jgi:hypothetical protein